MLGKLVQHRENHYQSEKKMQVEEVPISLYTALFVICGTNTTVQTIDIEYLKKIVALDCNFIVNDELNSKNIIYKYIHIIIFQE